MKTKRGFTLIEICIVLAIILILAAILFPVFGRVRENARQASCLSNLKQIGLAMQQYVQDNNGSYPGVGLRGSSWTAGLFPYLKNDAVFNCPSEEHTDNAFENGERIRGQHTDYSYNIAYFGETSTGKWLGTNEARHTPIDTSRLMMLVENAEDTIIAEEVMAPCGKMSAGNEFITFSTLHSGGSNVAFADNHVKWLTPQTAAANYCALREFFPPPVSP